jgi:hypothetical protein
LSRAARTRRAASSRANPGDPQRQRHVLEAAAVEEQLVVLEYETHAPAQHRERGVAEGAQVLAIDHHGAGGRPLDTRGELEQRRLARAGVARHRHHLAVPDVEGDAAQRLMAARITLGDPGEADHAKRAST